MIYLGWLFTIGVAIVLQVLLYKDHKIHQEEQRRQALEDEWYRKNNIRKDRFYA